MGAQGKLGAQRDIVDKEAGKETNAEGKSKGKNKGHEGHQEAPGAEAPLILVEGLDARESRQKR